MDSWLPWLIANFVSRFASRNVAGTRKRCLDRDPFSKWIHLQVKKRLSVSSTAHAQPIHLVDGPTHQPTENLRKYKTQKAWCDHDKWQPPWMITPSSITPPTVGRWPPNLFHSLTIILTHQPMCRQLQSHYRFNVRHRRPSRTHTYTISTSRDLGEAISPPIWIKPLPIAFE
jgi:hypothetical protein